VYGKQERGQLGSPVGREAPGAAKLLVLYYQNSVVAEIESILGSYRPYKVTEFGETVFLEHTHNIGNQGANSKGRTKADQCSVSDALFPELNFRLHLFRSMLFR
jgi:hypothetical protein